jgi:hypothetical protein
MGPVPQPVDHYAHVVVTIEGRCSASPPPPHISLKEEVSHGYGFDPPGEDGVIVRHWQSRTVTPVSGPR